MRMCYFISLTSCQVMNSINNRSLWTTKLWYVLIGSLRSFGTSNSFDSFSSLNDNEPMDLSNPGNSEPISTSTSVRRNCQSVSAKLPNFLNLIDTVDPDVKVGTESWLHENIASGDFFPPNFNVYRKDRLGVDSHGGMFLAIKERLNRPRKRSWKQLWSDLGKCSC